MDDVDLHAFLNNIKEGDLVMVEHEHYDPTPRKVVLVEDTRIFIEGMAPPFCQLNGWMLNGYVGGKRLKPYGK
jgi:hypothetical protein